MAAAGHPTPTEAPDFERLFESELKGSSPADPEFFKTKVYQVTREKGVKVPWDTGRVQSSLVCLKDQFHGDVLDVGCGLGDNARWLASLPSVASVTAVDVSNEAISEACRRQAACNALHATKVKFVAGDVFNLPFTPAERSFDVWLDSAVFHCIGDDDAQRRYLKAVTPYIKMGGRAIMLVMSDANPEGNLGPRRISKDHATKLWTEAGWKIDRIDDVMFDMAFPMTNLPGHAILMQATRIA